MRAEFGTAMGTTSPSWRRFATTHQEHSMTNGNRLALAALVIFLGGCAATGPTPVAIAPAITPAITPAMAAAVTTATGNLGAETTPGVPSSAIPASLSNPAGAATRARVAVVPPIFPTGPLTPLAANNANPHVVATLTPPADLWERIRRGYAMPDLSNDLVSDRERWYASRPDYIERMTERSSKYLFHIVEELERRNMPTELALLPFIESAFNPQAVSSAKAAGMWQFMPATGKHFELKQNAFRDDRRDVLASTRAALDYLQKLHRMFGDWHLALAAYNWGQGSVGRAIERNRKAGLGTGYEDLKMPAETRMYVPKLQAVKNIVLDPRKLNTVLPVIENHPYFQSVEITRDIDVAMAAKLANVALDDFKALNPSAHRPVILAAGTPQILLPWDNAATFRANLQASADRQLASWTAWQAPSTMRPADVAHKVGMTESDLRAVNQIPNGMVIKAGSTVLVRRSAQVREDVAEAIADNAQLTLGRQLLQVRQIVRAGKNDNVAKLARRHKVAASSVAEWNKLTPSSALKQGQRVTVYLPARSNAASSAVRSASTRATAARSKQKPVKVARD
jgi:membrane-bound lytic murein transglycosylase D